MSFARLLVALACALCWLASATRSTAQVARLVQLDYDTAPTARATAQVVRRLVAELRLAGFTVTLPGSAEAVRAPARIAISKTATGLQLELAMAVEGASSHVVLAGSEQELGALALQASEFLHAGLVPRAPQPRRAAIPAPAPRALPVVSPSGASFFDVGASLMTNGAAADHLPLASFGGGYAWPERVAASLGLDVPLAAATFHTGSGRADYRLWLATAYVDYGLLRWPRGKLSLGSCVGAARTTTTGHATAPAESRSPASWSLTLGARASLELRMTEHLSFISQLRVLALSPNPVVAVLSEERRLGGPSLLLQLGARVGD